MNSLFSIWCQLCKLGNAFSMLCTSLDMVVANNTLISENNVLIKTKITDLVGDPDDPCPECPEGEGARLEEARISTADAKNVTAVMKQNTEALKLQSARVKSALGLATEGKTKGGEG